MPKNSRGNYQELKKFFKSQWHSWAIDIEHEETKETPVCGCHIIMSCRAAAQIQRRQAKFTRMAAMHFPRLLYVERHQEKEGGNKRKNNCYKNPLQSIPANTNMSHLYSIQMEVQYFQFRGELELQNQRVWK